MTLSHTPGLESPIFIGGLANSGKTPVRRMLEAHPELAFTRRTYLWTKYHGVGGDLSDSENLDLLLALMNSDPGVAALGPDVDRIKKEFAFGSPTHTRLFALMHSHHAAKLGRRRWGDQLGMIEAFADVIFADLPKARFIHMVRDPRTRATGSAPGRWGWELARWRQSAELALGNQRSFEKQYLVVRYESLTADPMRVLNEICSFIGEEVHPNMRLVLDRIEFDTPNPTAATGPENPIEPYATSAMADLGYVVESGRETRGTRMQNLWGRLAMWAGTNAWSVTARRRSRSITANRS